MRIMNRLKIGKLTSIFIALALTISLSGCNNPGRSTKAKQIVFGQINEKMPLDVTKSNLLQTLEMSNVIFEGLMKTDSKTGEKVPCLAESYEISNNHKEYTFHIKQGVKFHGGEILTAKDVKFSFERVMSPQIASSAATNLLSIKGAREKLDGNAQNVAGIELIDDYTIKFINDEEFVTSFDSIGNLPIYPEKACTEAGETWGKEDIIGTGPFMVKSFDMDHGCEVLKFDDYHGQKPNIDSIYFKFFDEINTLMLDYEAKNVDFLILSDKLTDQYINHKKYKSHVKSFNPDAVYFVVMNVAKEPWNNIKVREAFTYAIDVNSLCKDLTSGKVTEAGSLMLPKIEGFNPDLKPKEYNPEKSLQILKEAGVSVPLKIEMPVATLESWRGQLAVAIQDQARKAGFEISTPIMDGAALADLKFKGQRSLGIADWYFGTNTPNMDEVFYTFFHSSKSTNYSSCYQNTEFDSLVQTARKTFDSAKRAELYSLADKKIVSDDIVAIPIGYPKEYYMTQPWVKDFEIQNLNFPFEFCDIDLTKKR